MSDLTREYLDKKLDGQTKEIKSYVDDRISSVEENLETKIEGLETKIETEVGRLEMKIESEVGRLEVKIESEVAELARMTNNGFEEIKRELDVRKEVANLDRRTFRIEQALNIKN